MSDKTLRVPWTARRSHQSILKEISPEHSLEGLMLKPQYFAHVVRITNSLEKTLMLGKIEGGRRRGQQRVRWLDGITDSMDMSLIPHCIAYILHTKISFSVYNIFSVHIKTVGSGA